MEQVSDAFKKTIKKYLDEIAQIDDNFAEQYENNPQKNIDDCCKYVLFMAKKGGCSGYDDKEVYGWAIHYYEEPEVKFEKTDFSKVVVNHHVDLTEEEKEEAKKKAKEEYIKSCIDKMKASSLSSSKKSVRHDDAVAEEEQLSLF